VLTVAATSGGHPLAGLLTVEAAVAILGALVPWLARRR
jgi:hypothetical protein